jgi:hypothetical protein
MNMLSWLPGSWPGMVPEKVRLLADMAVQVNLLVNGIVRASYNPFPGQGQRKDVTIFAQWSKLRWHLRLMWLFRYYNSFQDYLHGIRTDGVHEKVEPLK